MTAMTRSLPERFSIGNYQFWQFWQSCFIPPRHFPAFVANNTLRQIGACTDLGRRSHRARTALGPCLGRPSRIPWAVQSGRGSQPIKAREMPYFFNQFFKDQAPTMGRRKIVSDSRIQIKYEIVQCPKLRADGCRNGKADSSEM
jgi:hypothetical protein